MPSHRPRPALRVSLSHHRLRSAAIAHRIVACTGLAPPSLVVEAGAGEGVLTAALVRRAGRVIAVERDRSLWTVLKRRFAACPSVEPVLGDIRSFRQPREPFTFVSNLPFSVTAELMRMLVTDKTAMDAAFVVLQRDAALHWSGDGRSSVASACAAPEWHMEVRLALRRDDFVPRPAVDCVLLAMVRRPRPLIAPGERESYRRFVRDGFGGGHGTARRNLRRQLSSRAFVRAATRLGFDRDAIPSELSHAQWLQLFEVSRGRGG